MDKIPGLHHLCIYLGIGAFHLIPASICYNFLLKAVQEFIPAYTVKMQIPPQRDASAKYIFSTHLKKCTESHWAENSLERGENETFSVLHE